MVDVAYAEARTYAPLREYGGWGIRGLSRKRAYNVSGNRGVELSLVDGRKLTSVINLMSIGRRPGAGCRRPGK